jgi:hypothetical protein
VQFSLYVVYLNGLGLTGTTIGILFAAIEIMSALGSLFAGRAMRFGDPQKTMLSGTVASILLSARRRISAASSPSCWRRRSPAVGCRAWCSR